MPVPVGGIGQQFMQLFGKNLQVNGDRMSPFGCSKEGSQSKMTRKEIGGLCLTGHALKKLVASSNVHEKEICSECRDQGPWPMAQFNGIAGKEDRGHIQAITMENLYCGTRVQSLGWGIKMEHIQSPFTQPRPKERV